MDSSRDHYINSARVATSVYEVLVEFGKTTPADLPGESSESHDFRVRMSPQHAKALAALLVKHVREYERQYGAQLIIPEDVQSLWAEIGDGGKQP